MQNIFIEKPYQFIRPLMSKSVAHFFNNRLIHIPLLRFTESIIGIESRGVDRLRNSIEAGHAVLMVGNHPNVSDPVAIYDLVRQAGSPIFAMASWHLFNQTKLHTAIIRLYGGYSINREGLDRESINFSISNLQNNVRPVLMFPEGATTRTNEALMPFLEGPTFIARTVARRRNKTGLKTVIHPIAFRYRHVGDFDKDFDRLIVPAEEMLGLSPMGNERRNEESNERRNEKPVTRVQAALDAMVARKENEFGISGDASLEPFERRQRLADAVMDQAELRCFGEQSNEDFANRIRNVRAHAFPEILTNELSAEEKAVRWRDLERTYLAWQMASYPRDYLKGNPSNERILEIAAKVLEDLTDQRQLVGRQKVIIECCEAIEVPVAKHRGSEPDPLETEIRETLLAKMRMKDL